MYNTSPSLKGAPLYNDGIYNGYEYDTKYYKYSNSSFILSKEVLTSYKDDPRLSSDSVYYFFKADAGLQYAISGTVGGSTTANISQIPSLSVAKYRMLSRWIYPDSITTIDYSDDGSPLTTTQISTYNNIVHQQVSQKSMVNSKGETLMQQYYYPMDDFTLTDADALAAKASLESQHIYSPMLRKEFYNNGTLLRQEENYYSNNLFSNSPVMGKHLETALGQTTKKYEVTRYDAAGGISEVVEKGNDPSSYLWDYKGQYAVAQVRNALQSDIAYSSFEADGTGNWIFASFPLTTTNGLVTTGGITGNNAYNLGATGAGISNTSLTATQTYTVTYWSTGGAATISSTGGTVTASPTQPLVTKTINGTSWSLYSYQVKGATGITISGTTTIDELRLYPVGAQMSTYTYTPLVGISSQCDINNKVTYYVYDSLGRVLMIRDQDGNIIKKYDYEYKKTP